MGAPVRRLERERAARPWSMWRVREKNLLEREPEFGETAVNARGFIAWVDDEGFTRFFVARMVQLACQRTDGEGFPGSCFPILRGNGCQGSEFRMNCRRPDEQATEDAGAGWRVVGHRAAIPTGR